MTTLASEAREFRSALATQMRVVGALVLRETRVRFGRSQFGYLWAIIEPTAYICVLAWISSAAGRHPPIGNSSLLFFATGFLPFSLFRNLGNQLGGAFSANKALMTYPIVQPIDTVLARAALESATILLIGTIIVVGLVLIAGAPMPHNPLRVLEGLTLLAGLGFGLGLLNAVIGEIIPSWHNIYRLLMTPMMFISGVFFSLGSLPVDVRRALAWNPVLHGIEIVRSGYYANFRAAGLDQAYLAIWTIGLVLVALTAERTFRGYGNE